MPESLGITPVSTVQRLSVYLRTLLEVNTEDDEFISSIEIAERNGYTSAQVRKDFSCFGSFGKKGKGYHVDSLISSLMQILGLDSHWHICIIGLGKIGAALAKYKGFQRSSFEICGIFDSDPKKVGIEYNGIQVHHPDNLKRIARERNIEMAIIAVPTRSAKDAIENVISAGIKGILNFTEARIVMPEGFLLKNVNLSAELETISFYLTQPELSCRG